MQLDFCLINSSAFAGCDIYSAKLDEVCTMLRDLASAFTKAWRVPTREAETKSPALDSLRDSERVRGKRLLNLWGRGEKANAQD